MKFFAAVALLCGVLVILGTPGNILAGIIPQQQQSVLNPNPSLSRPEAHEVFEDCFAHKCYQRTCAGESLEGCVMRCDPGYVCAEGYVREYTDGPCILEKSCPRIHSE